jgi:hypothetical protein
MPASRRATCFAGRYAFFPNPEEPPNQGDLTAWQIARIADPLSEITSVPVLVSKIVAKCLEKNRDHRFASCQDLGNVLRAARERLAKDPTRGGAAMPRHRITPSSGAPRVMSPERLGLADTEPITIEPERADRRSTIFRSRLRRR